MSRSSVNTDSRRWNRLVVASCIAAVLVCGGVAGLIFHPRKADPDTLIVYSSFPLQGAQAKQSEDMVKAIDLALKEVGGKAGRFTVKHISRDDSTKARQGFTAAVVANNAKEAADDARTAGYIGDFNSGATATAIPILSEARVAQISPASTAVGLTRRGPSADPGEPDSYYYDGFRNFARLVPTDRVQARALVRLMKADGCRDLVMVNDGEVYGRRLARDMRDAARHGGLPIVLDSPVGSRERTLPAIAARRAASCVLFSGATSAQAIRIFTAMAFALPGAMLYGPDGVSDQAFVNGRRGGIPAEVATRTKLTAATFDRASYGPAGTDFFDAFEKRYHDPEPEVYAIYAYDAMNLLLDAIVRSDTGKREDIVKALFAPKKHQGALGRYSIDAKGDTTLTDYGVFKISNGRLVFLRKI